MKTKFSTQIKTSKWMFLLTMVFLASSCSKDDPVEPTAPPVGTNPAITLECDYFNEDRTLIDDPEAPVDYIVTCEAKVLGSLIIEPGVVIAFEQDAGLRFEQVNGLITMDGTAEKPIILTGTQKTKGHWAGILFINTNPANSMKYVTIEYAGSRSMQWDWLGAFCIGQEGNMTIDNCIFSNSKGSGISWNFDSNYQVGSYITNSVMNGNDYPMSVSSGFNSTNLFNATNSYTGNVNDYVQIYYGGINEDATWKKINVPYYVITRTYNRFDVNNDAKLIIEPGTEIIFSSETKFRFFDGASIIMVGTPSDKIILRGMDDVAGAWNYLIVSSSSVLNEIAYVDVRNAGDPTDFPNGAVAVDDEAYLNIHDVTFTNCFKYALSFHFGFDHDPDYTIALANLTLNNTPKMFATWCGVEIPDPYTWIDCP